MANATDIGTQVSDRFHLVNGLPATTLVLFVGLTMSTGAFGGGASIANLRDGLASVGLAELGIVAFLVLIVALMSNAFQTPMVKALEDFWKPAGLRVRLRERGLARHDERRQRYRVAQTAQYRPTRLQSLFLRLLT